MSAATALITRSSLVTAIGIFRMFQIPQRAPAGDARNGWEVVSRRWRTDGPFERPAVPWILAGPGALPVGDDQVCDEHQDADGLDERADRDDQVDSVPPTARFVGVDAARHAQQSREVHRIKREMEAKHEQPEMKLAQTLAQHAAGDLGIPVIERSEEREENAADDDVVEMRHDEVGEAQLPVERG